MNDNQNLNLINSLISLFQQMAHQNHEALRRVEQYCNLTPASRKSLAAAKYAAIYANRTCNVIKYLLNNSNAENIKFESFEINSMLKEILSRFESIVSTFNNVSVSFKSTLDDSAAFAVSKTHFELVILNLLYCAIKTKASSTPADIKISVSVTENKDSFVLHIHDNNKYPEEYNILLALENENPHFLDEINIGSDADMIIMSLSVAQKAAKELCGKLSYTPLKSGNRYDIYLPKTAPVSAYALYSPGRYIPTNEYFTETFAEFNLAHILSYNGEWEEYEFEGVKKL